MADFSQAIDQLHANSPIVRSKTLLARGELYEADGNTESACADYSRVVALPGAPVDEVAHALFNRALLHEKLGHVEDALADLTAVIDSLQDVPDGCVARCLARRGDLLCRKGDKDGARADYSHVIDRLPKAPALAIAKVLMTRGMDYWADGEFEKARVDFSRLIDELPGLPADVVATAFGLRGWTLYSAHDHDGFFSDISEALRRCPDIDFVSFNHGLALLTAGRDKEAIDAYRAAAERFPLGIALAMSDLADASKSWLGDTRGDPAMELLQSLLRV